MFCYSTHPRLNACSFVSYCFVAQLYSLCTTSEMALDWDLYCSTNQAVVPRCQHSPLRQMLSVLSIQTASEHAPARQSWRRSHVHNLVARRWLGSRPQSHG